MSSKRIDCVCGNCKKSYQKRADRVQTPDFCGLECRKDHRAKRMQRSCLTCGETFIPRTTQIAVGAGNHCSHKCHGASIRGKNNPTFKGSGTDERGYRWLLVDGVRLQEHRYIAEQAIGRSLKKGEVVHHINEVKDDNRPENLQVMTISEHMQLHASQRWAARRAANG